MAGLTEFYCGWNEPSHASQFKWLEYTFKQGVKPDKKPYPLPYGLRNPYRNLKSENSQDYAKKPQ
jgi:hypothetical protein